MTMIVSNDLAYFASEIVQASHLDSGAAQISASLIPFDSQCQAADCRIEIASSGAAEICVVL